MPQAISGYIEVVMISSDLLVVMMLFPRTCDPLASKEASSLTGCGGRVRLPFDRNEAAPSY